MSEVNGQRVLVAGATGYLGRYVAQEFKRQGYWVRVLARDPDKLSRPGKSPPATTRWTRMDEQASVNY